MIMKKIITSPGKPGEPHVMVMGDDGDPDMVMRELTGMDDHAAMRMMMIEKGGKSSRSCTSSTADDGTRTIICKIGPEATQAATARTALQSARKAIEASRDLTDSQRKKALAGLDHAEAELSAAAPTK